MKLSCFCKGNFSFKILCKKICDSIGWELPNQLIVKQSARFIHKILSKRKPKQVIDKIRFPRTRACAKLSMKITANCEKLRRTTIYQCIELYNQIPNELKSQDQKEFKKSLKRTALTFMNKPD